MRDVVSGMIFAGFWIFITSFVLWAVLFNGYLGLGNIIVFGLLFMLQTSLRGIVISQVLPGRMAFLFTVTFLFFQISLSPVLIGQTVPASSLAIMACIISPMLQLNLVFHMGVVQFAQGNNLNFTNLSLEVFPGLNLGIILIIALCMTSFYALVIVYLWPYKIETDPENPLSWYYPFTCSYWRQKKDGQNGENYNRIQQKTFDDQEKRLLDPLIEANVS